MVNNYGLLRLQQYGITENLNWFPLYFDADYKKQYPHLEPRTPAFTVDDDGCIAITYLSLYGQLATYSTESARHKKTYVRTRLTKEKLLQLGRNPDDKYSQPTGSGVHLYFTPQVIHKYKTAQQSETTYLVEGEFKAFMLWSLGLDVIGLPSINGYKLKGENNFHPDLLEYARVCKPKNLVMIYDADCIMPKWEKWNDNHDYDLGKRFNLFYKTAQDIREYGKNIAKDVYLSQVKTELLIESIFSGSDDKVKGVDDLILHKHGYDVDKSCPAYHYDNRQKAHDKANAPDATIYDSTYLAYDVARDLIQLAAAKKYFNTINISSESPVRLREYFLIAKNKFGVPQQFYARFAARLQQQEFLFNGSRYKWNLDKEDLELTQHIDSNKFIRVAGKYLKIILIPNSKKKLERKLIEWPKGEITLDYVNKGFKTFFDMIDKYDAFCNVPDHTETYQQVVEGCYNLYYKMLHIPEKGSISNTKKYLEHVFGDKLEIAYDYLTMLYKEPTQKLPIIALVSKEKNTGKSTFIWWLCEMFGENVSVIGNQELTDNFNDDYASKLAICIDEGFIDKKLIMEKLKSWSTAIKISLSTKFATRQQISFFAKMIITSNNEDNFIQIDPDETRFWIVKVPMLQGEDDPNMLDKLTAEVPAFLEFLKARKVKYPKKSRHWFDHRLLDNKALETVRNASKSWLYKEVHSFMTELFFDCKWHSLYFNVTELMELINRNNGAKFRQAEIRRVLNDEFKITAKWQRAAHPKKVNEWLDSSTREFYNKEGRLYHFKAEEFLNAIELAELGFNELDLKAERSTGITPGPPEDLEAPY